MPAWKGAPSQQEVLHEWLAPRMPEVAEQAMPRGPSLRESPLEKQEA